jgi:hypothetical protein
MSAFADGLGTGNHEFARDAPALVQRNSWMVVPGTTLTVKVKTCIESPE